MVIKGYLFSFLYAAICLFIAYAFHKWLSAPRKYTRKIVHILIGGEWVILYRFFGSGLHFLIVCIAFLIVLLISYKYKLMDMISSDSDNAPGTIYYAVAMTGVALLGCFIPEIMLPFGIGVMCTSVGDGFAGVIGQINCKANVKIYGEKTLFGTTSNFVLSSLSAFLVSYIYEIEISSFWCVAIGFLSASLELISEYGLDNIMVTWGTTSLSYAAMYFDNIGEYVVPILLTPLIYAFAKQKRALTNSGIAAALLLDLVVSVSLGNYGFIILLSFFTGGIFTDKIKNNVKKEGRKSNFSEINEKGECRDYVQVLANGLIPAFAALMHFITGHNAFALIFAAGFAESMADTAASGIGAFSSRTFDPFRWKKCETGISGGMSILGTFASLFASILITGIAFLLNSYEFGLAEFFIVVFSGFAGSICDSFLGSLLQAKYKCKVCNTITEKTRHCNEDAELAYGLSCINNDVVNITSCAFSTIAAAVLLLVI